jgi:Ca2+-binding EF-hand superfamily protein
MPSFEDFDLDGDGGITEEEFHEARAKRIADRAKRGYPMRNIGNAPAFGEIDSDDDGAVSREEFAAHQARHRESRSGAAHRDK